jgi:hypothetical protein
MPLSDYLFSVHMLKGLERVLLLYNISIKVVIKGVELTPLTISHDHIFGDPDHFTDPLFNGKQFFKNGVVQLPIHIKG